MSIENFNQTPVVEAGGNQEKKEKNPIVKKIEKAMLALSLIGATFGAMADQIPAANFGGDAEADEVTLTMKAPSKIMSVEDMNNSQEFMYDLMRREALDQGMDKEDVEKMMTETAKEENTVVQPGS